MIAKPIEEIEWQDLTALQDAGREEGQQLEYKSSFKGGDDFLGLNEQRKKNAVESLAREVISFLNASGGANVTAQKARLAITGRMVCIGLSSGVKDGRRSCK